MDKRSKARDRYSERQKIISKYKLARGCMDCGYDGHPAALDFDHVRGSKKFSIAGNSTRSMASVWEEIEKCEVVCANCHRIRTAVRRDDKDI